MNAVGVVERVEDRILMSVVDLTSSGAFSQLQDGYVEQVVPRTTGSGVIHSFARLNADQTEQGYNTDYRPRSVDPVLADMDNSPQYNRSLLLSTVPQVIIGGRAYREFRLDINEVSSEDRRLLALDKVQIFLGNAPDLTGFSTFGGNAVKVWDMDTGPGGDSAVILNCILDTGSGSGDMALYVPESAFQAGDPATRPYVYLYSQFGQTKSWTDGTGATFNTESDDGFEEWFTAPSLVGEIRGYKFNDLNGNGIDDGEPRLSGWGIELQAWDDTNGDNMIQESEWWVAATTGTDSAGEYAFTGLLAGHGELSTYRVREIQQTYWFQTTVNPPAMEIHTISVGSANKPDLRGEVFIAIDGLGGHKASDPEVTVEPTLAFGNQYRAPKLLIAGLKFEDVNGDGDGAGDPGLQGWVIDLYLDSNDDGVPTPDEMVTSDTTDEFGGYQFAELDPSEHDYLVREEGQTGWIQTTPNPDPIDGSGTDPVVGVNFGNFHQIVIRGRKFEDLRADADGTGDPGLADWTVSLYQDDGDGLFDPLSDVLIDQALTGTDGSYALDGLDDQGAGPGIGGTGFTYFVVEVGQDGWVQSYPVGENWHVIPVSGQESTGNDFGNYLPFDIRGRKYEDMNGDGDGTGDPGLEGWVIDLYLDTSGDGVADPSEWVSQSTTVSDGTYAFEDLSPSIYNYLVVQESQTGWRHTAGPGPVEAVSGQDVTQKDFGNFHQIAISGQKFWDMDLTGDGIYLGTKDPWDPALGNWTIELYEDDGDGVFDPLVDAKIDQALTDGMGNYSLDGLDDLGNGPGIGGTGHMYFVAEVLQTDWTQTYPASGTYDVVATSGQDVTGLDFGNTYTPPDLDTLDIAGMKFQDKDASGTYDDTIDMPLPGWTIELHMGGFTIATTVTDQDGKYYFGGLLGVNPVTQQPIEYEVYEVIPQMGSPVTQQVVVKKLAGDANMDGVVDLADFSLLKSNFARQAGSTWTEGDFNGNGHADLGDFSALKAHFHHSESEPGQAGNLVSVNITAPGNVWLPSTPGAPGPIIVAGEVGLDIYYMPWEGFVDPALKTPRYNIGLAFGNVRLVARDARTLGFWSNKNGQALIASSWDAVAGVYTDLVALDDLNLMGPGTTPFNPDPTHMSSNPKANELNNWLLDGDAVDMHYMLSVQMAAMELNLLHGFVLSIDKLLVTNPDGTLRAVLVTDLINEANAALVDPNATREYLESLKNALDDGNNNLNWVG